MKVDFGLYFAPLAFLAAPVAAQELTKQNVEIEHSSVAVPVATGTLDIDDDLVPAIMPYMQCLADSAGVPTYSNEKRVKTQFDVGTDCGAQRELSKKNSSKILRRMGFARDKIEPRVNAQFDAIDKFQLDKERGQEPASLSADVVRRHQSYVDCLMAKLRSGSPMPIGACRNEREQSASKARVTIGSELAEADASSQIANALGQIDEFFNVPSR